MYTVCFRLCQCKPLPNWHKLYLTHYSLSCCYTLLYSSSKVTNVNNCPGFIKITFVQQSFVIKLVRVKNLMQYERKKWWYRTDCANIYIIYSWIPDGTRIERYVVGWLVFIVYCVFRVWWVNIKPCWSTLGADSLSWRGITFHARIQRCLIVHRYNPLQVWPNQSETRHFSFHLHRPSFINILIICKICLRHCF